MATPAENKTVETAAPVMTPEQRDKAISALPPKIQQGIRNAIAAIVGHNSNVAIVKAASADNTAVLLHEVRENNPAGDKRLASIMANVRKLDEEREKLIADANKIAEKYLPEKKSPEQVKAAHESTKGAEGSSTKIRNMVKALKDAGDMFDMDFVSLLPKVESLQGVRLGSSETPGESVPTPRFSQIFVDGDLIQVKTKVNGEEVFRSTMNALAKDLTARTEGKVDVTRIELTTAFAKSQNVPVAKVNEIPDGVFSFEFSLDVPGSDGKILGTKKWNIMVVRGKDKDLPVKNGKLVETTDENIMNENKSE